MGVAQALSPKDLERNDGKTRNLPTKRLPVFTFGTSPLRASYLPKARMLSRNSILALVLSSSQLTRIIVPTSLYCLISLSDCSCVPTLALVACPLWLGLATV